MSGSEEDREENRRIWWTLTTLDLEIGMRGGSPTLIDDRYLKVTTSSPLERIAHHPVGAYIIDACCGGNTYLLCVGQTRILRDIYAAQVAVDLCGTRRSKA